MTRRIFLSFDGDDLNLVNLFRGHAGNPNLEIDFYDGSLKDEINSKNADYIKSVIRPKIKNASVTVCLLGSNTYTSKWVDWELMMSHDAGNGIVGVRLHSNASDIPPDRLSKLNGIVVNWNQEQINNAIETAAKNAGY